MRLYLHPHAPNALKVQIVLLEKGITADLVDVSDDPEGYRAINPLGQVPALALDDGSVITESLVIAQYLDRISGAPHFFGDGPDEALAIAMWERRAEMALFNPGVEYGHQIHPMFAGQIAQFPDYAATLVPKAREALRLFDDRLQTSRHIAGERFSMADVTALIGVLCWIGYGAVTLAEAPRLAAWFGETLQRPSMEPVRAMMAWAATLAPA